jgi:heme oxygenase
LDQDRRETERLEAALRLNQPMAPACYLQEDLRQLWEQPNKAAATVFLEDWVARAETAGIAFLVKFSKTMSRHRCGLLACCD